MRLQIWLLQKGGEILSGALLLLATQVISGHTEDSDN